MLNPSDEQLIAKYLRGDEESLEVLIKRYLKPIYVFAYRYLSNKEEAEDITQEVFVKVWRNLKKFNRQKSFKTWIFSIAKNSCIDALRKKKTRAFSDFENEEGENLLANTFADASPLPNEILERADLAEMLRGAMNQLSPKYRLVLFLRYNDHFTFREIAESLGEPPDTVKSRHKRALIMLKKLLSDPHSP